MWSLAILRGQPLKLHHLTSFQSLAAPFYPPFQASFCRQLLPPVSKQSTVLVGGKSYPRSATPKPVENNQPAISTCSTTSQGCSSSLPLAFIAIINAEASVGVKVERLAFGVFGWLLACFWRSEVYVSHPSTVNSIGSCSHGASVKNFLNRLGSVCRENRRHFRLLSWGEAVWHQKQANVVVLATVEL